jgi:multidrug transporter EmrE-like cation transporter
MNKLLSPLVLIIMSALLDSIAAFIVKNEFNKLGPMDHSSIGTMVSYLISFFKSPILILGIIAFVSAPGLWFLALNKIDLSIGYPVLVGFHLIFVFIFGTFLLNEGITFNKIVGCFFVFLSIYFFYKK